MFCLKQDLIFKETKLKVIIIYIKILLV